MTDLSTDRDVLADVSRETLQRLEHLVSMLAKWNPAINLVSRNTLVNAWDRHIADSAQLFDLVPDVTGLWADLGSGAGFPGMVIAILAAEKAPALSVVLVESDQRKATFLRQVRQVLGISVDIVADRVEELAPLGARTVSARALAPLDKLCGFAHRHLAPDGVAVFPKGETFAAEITLARQSWAFDLETRSSRVNPASNVLLLRRLAHV